MEIQHISLQFHINYDNWFTTTYMNNMVLLDTWEQLFLYHHEQIPISPKDTAHVELVDE